MLELATDVCRDINQAAGQFSAMQKVVLQAATDHHLEICGGGTHPFQKWQRQEVCDNERYQRTLENFGYLIQQATVLVSMSMLAAPVAMTPFICCTACHDLCRTLSPFPPRRHMQGTDTRFASSRPNIFPPFLIMARCRGSVTGNNLKPCFAV